MAWTKTGNIKGADGPQAVSTDSGNNLSLGTDSKLFYDDASLYKLDGSRALTGDMDAAGNKLTDVASVNGLEVSLGGGSKPGNAAVGKEALGSNTSGGSNTAFGYLALGSNTSGGFNTAVGYGAGRYTALSQPNKTGSSSILIGGDTRPAADGETNQIVIGVSAVGNGSNSVTLGSDAITKTYLKGDVLMPDGLSIGKSTAPTEALDVVGNAVVSGSVIIGTSGKGIDFDPAGSGASANLLDDYEEGTWTPVLSDGTNNATSSVAAGYYTRVGNLVNFQLRLAMTSLGSVSGAVRITGLPFVSNAFGSSEGGCYSHVSAGLNLPSIGGIVGRITSSSTYIRLYTNSSTTNAVALTASQWTAGGQAYFVGQYLV